VENEIEHDYLPLCCEDEAESDTGTIEYSLLTMPCVRIIRVTDEYGNSVPFKLFPQYLRTQPGRVNVSYTYTPREKNAEEESDFVLSVSPRLFAYGIASEYSLAAGLFEEAAVWDKKYNALGGGVFAPNHRESYVPEGGHDGKILSENISRGKGGRKENPIRRLCARNGKQGGHILFFRRAELSVSGRENGDGVRFSPYYTAEGKIPSVNDPEDPPAAFVLSRLLRTAGGTKERTLISTFTGNGTVSLLILR